MFVQVHDSFANATGLQTLTADDGELQQQAHPHQQYEHQPPSRYHWPSVAHCGSLGTAPRSMQWSNSHMNSSSTPNLWLPKELARFCTYIYHYMTPSKLQRHKHMCAYTFHPYKHLTITLEASDKHLTLSLKVKHLYIDLVKHLYINLANIWPYKHLTNI